VAAASKQRCEDELSENEPVHGYLDFSFKTVIEYGGNSRVKSVPKPSTFSVRGTTLFGSVMEFVASRLSAARTTASPLALMDFAPLSWILMGRAEPEQFTTFR
jgi:hypothetical protein